MKSFLLLLSILFVSFTPIPKKPPYWDHWTFSKKVIWRGKNLDPRIPYELLVDKLKVKEIMQAHVLVAKTLFATDEPKKISVANLPKTYLMKANNGSGRGLLVKDGILLARKKRDLDFIP